MNILLRVLYNIGLVVDVFVRLALSYWALFKAHRIKKRFEKRGLKVYK